MYQLLIVDDEAYSIMGIERGVNFQKIGVSSVFKAYDIRHAKEIFKHNRVDIVLTDIEMPQGSGLDLLEWVKNRYPDTQVIVLSCHTDFVYARKALQLGSIDYVSKSMPYAELENVIRQALLKYDSKRQLNEYSKLWCKNKTHLAKQFWIDIISGNIEANREAIRKAAVNFGIDLPDNMEIVPMLIQIETCSNVAAAGSSVPMADLLNYISNFLLIADRKGTIITHDNHNFLIIFEIEKSELIPTKDFEADIHQLISDLRNRFYVDMYCYVGYRSNIEDTFRLVTCLYDFQENSVMSKEITYLTEEKPTAKQALATFNDETWLPLLKDSLYGRLLQEIEDYFNNAVKQGNLDAAALQQFQIHFMQILYSFLGEKGLNTSEILNDRVSAELFGKAKNSLYATMEWVTHIIGKIQDCDNHPKASSSMIGMIKKFIDLHIDQSFSRDDVARHVHLNPDYLTRFFKKETGLTLSEYIQEQRIKMAKVLLEKTDLNIGNIAERLGYSNFSHFARMFKDNTGMSPMMYKNSCKNVPSRQA